MQRTRASWAALPGPARTRHFRCWRQVARGSAWEKLRALKAKAGSLVKAAGRQMETVAVVMVVGDVSKQVLQVAAVRRYGRQPWGRVGAGLPRAPGTGVS